MPTDEKPGAMRFLRMTPQRWRFEDFFGLPSQRALRGPARPCIEQARACVERSEIGRHPFFELAHTDVRALHEWAKQEAVITNSFSQIVFALLAQIPNVHVRAMLTPVVADEHGALANGVATQSHPYLLYQLIRRLGILPESIAPAPCTTNFATALAGCLRENLYAFGFLGVGNEALLLPEYGAVTRAFAQHYSEDVYSPFLAANMEADEGHSTSFDLAASVMMTSAADERLYVSGAEDGVAARVKYYHELLEYCLAMDGADKAALR